MRIAFISISDLTEMKCNSRRKAIAQRDYSESGIYLAWCKRFQILPGKAQLPPDTKKASTKAGLFNAASRLLQTGSFTQQGGFVGFFPWEMFTTKVTVCRGFFVDWVQQIQHLNQAVWTQVEELAHQQGQLF